MSTHKILFPIVLVALLLTSCGNEPTDKRSAVVGQWAQITRRYKISEGETISTATPTAATCYTYYDFDGKTMQSYAGEGMYANGRLTVTSPFSPRGQQKKYKYRNDRLTIGDVDIDVKWNDDNCFYYSFLEERDSVSTNIELGDSVGKTIHLTEATVIFYAKISAMDSLMVKN